MKDKITFDIIGEDVMPIGGFYGPFNLSAKQKEPKYPDFIDEKYFKLIKDCGINLIVSPSMLYSSDKELVEKSLRLSEKYNMGYFVQDGYIETAYRTECDIDQAEIDRLVDALNKFPAFVGIHTRDEPQKKNFKILGEINNALFKSDFKGKHIYGNLLPDYEWAINFSGEDKNISYEEYVKGFIEQTKPQFLSLDHYVFDYYNFKKYFANLSLILKYAKRYNLPFWNFIQAGGYWNDGNREMPDFPHYPNEGELLWNVNTSLAYGAKGIQYFPLFQPKNFARGEGGKWDYGRNGVINALGQPTEWYGYIKRANEFIAKVDEYLINAEHLGVIASGAKAIKEMGEGEEIFKSGEFRVVRQIDGNALIGCFDYNGKTLLYAVNYSMAREAKIDIQLKVAMDFTVIYEKTCFNGCGETVRLQLDAGCAALVLIG